jgi:hypothetical protein
VRVHPSRKFTGSLRASCSARLFYAHLGVAELSRGV